MAQESCNLDKDKSDLLKSYEEIVVSKPDTSIPEPVIPKPHEEIVVSKPDTSIPEPVILKPHEEIVVSKPDTSIPEPASMPKFGKESNCAGTKLSCNRCLVCNRKVGIPGFRCRCGELYCAKHRYSDKHDCSFDYKSAGREEIARANPLIRASKIIKI